MSSNGLLTLLDDILAKRAEDKGQSPADKNQKNQLLGVADELLRGLRDASGSKGGCGDRNCRGGGGGRGGGGCGR